MTEGYLTLFILEVVSVLFYQPTLHVAGLRTEFHTDFHDLTTVAFERLGISLVADLPHRFLGASVQLELEDVDILWSLDNGIGTAFRTVYLGLRKLSHQLEYQVDYYLIMTFGLVVQLVGEVRKESLKTMHESVDVALA